MQLNAAQKCVKWIRPTKKSNNLATVYPGITQFCTDIHAYLVYSHTGYDVASYFQSAFIEVRKSGDADGFGSNFSIVRFASPNQMVGFLFSIMVKYSVLKSVHP